MALFSSTQNTAALTGGFFLELRIVTGNIAAQSMRLEPSFGQDARYSDVVGAYFGGNLASRPMRRAIDRFALGQSQHSGFESNAFFAATPSTMPAVEATETFPNKALLREGLPKEMLYERELLICRM